MSSLSTATLSNEEKRKALIRISQFVLRDKTEEIREGLEENIVEMALFWGTTENRPVTIDEIKQLVSKELYIISLHEAVLEKILARLMTKETIELVEEHKYCLKASKRIEIKKSVDANNKRIADVNQQLIYKVEQEYEAELTQRQRKNVLKNFYTFLSSLFIEESTITARIMARKPARFVPIELSLRTLKEALSKTSDVMLRGAQGRAIQQLFRDASNVFAGFLFSSMQNLVCVQILNLDPECKSLETEAFSKKVLFLDTNILVALLCPTDFLHKVVTELISFTQTLGAECCVTKRTNREYSNLLEHANLTYQRWQAPYRCLENADNEFLASFWFEKKSNPSQSWKGYYYRMRQVKSVLKKLGVVYYEHSHNEIIKDKNLRFETVSKRVYTCCIALRKRRKSRNVCAHDAYHLLLVRELRKNQDETFLGPNFWFVTADETLYCVDNMINQLPYQDKTPSSMLCDVWLEIISPFLRSPVRSGKALVVFSQLLQQKFATIPFEINTEDLIEIQGDWMKYNWLTTKDITRILNEEWVKKYIKKIREARAKEVPIPVMEGLATAFSTRLKEELSSIQDEKLRNLQTHIDEMSQKMKELETNQATLDKKVTEQQQTIQAQQKTMKSQQNQLGKQQQTILNQSTGLKSEASFKQVMRIIAAIAGLLLIVSPPSFILTRALPIDIITVLYSAGSFVVGAILLYFAIAPERAKVSLGAALKVSPK